MDPITLALITSAISGVAGAGANKMLSGGDDDGFQQYPRLDESQIPLYDQLQAANMKKGAGGSFGTAADYYRDLLSDDSQTYNQMSAPQLRQFREDIIPGLSEQFAGMGAGGLSSSGFRNAAVNAGTDLSERLGAIRAGLRNQGAQGLMQLGQIGLGDYTNNTYQQSAPGFLESAAPGIGSATTALASHYLNKPGDVKAPANPTIQPTTNRKEFNLPEFSLKGKTSPYGGPLYGNTNTPR